MFKSFQNWLKSIYESSNSTYEYGCAMVFYEFPQIVTLQDMIEESDIYTESGDNSYGLEDEPHTTLLFGFNNDVDPGEVLSMCKDFKYPPMTLENCSCFNNEKYDVLKFDVNSKVLHQVNSELKTKYDGRFTNSYPDYHPHSTIAYIKKGKGQHYVDLFKNYSFLVTPNQLVYSLPSVDKLKVKL
jgi:2'-5' RNA ligase